MSNLKKVTIRLEKDDIEELKDMFPAPVGYNKAIRTIVHGFIRAVRESAAQKQAPPQNLPEANELVADIMKGQMPNGD